ncbi:site-specific integrase [Vagococcus humatus]|uniref:Site-specific integrase n=1 Tax=Vagococcus humatus TaxID=1889241 RepID=A0A3R9YDG6_9ENTE|nr:site-specific integrase [Vagococcus humatus]RST88720.1 site-specific integrase [Vagococcus humatus]
MATFKQYVKKDGSKAWLFQAYLGVDPLTGKDIRTTRRGFKNKKEAQLALSRLKLDYEQGGLQKAENMTYQDVYDLWVVQYEKTVQESTYAKTTQIFRLHILPAFSKMKINKIDVLTCQKAVDKWASKLKKYRMTLSYANNVFKYAMTLGIISDNPLSKVIRPSVKDDDEDKIENYYTKDELKVFLDYMEQDKPCYIYTFFRLLAFSGMRKGEAFALTWEDIDFQTNTISINKALAQGKDNRLLVQPPKTKKSKRTISMDKDTMNILRKWRKVQQEDFLKLGINTLQPKQLVFSNIYNKHIIPSRSRKWMISIQEKYNLKRVTTHGLRHTHCSLLFEAGVPIERVQDRLGHSDIQTTMNIYTHVSEKIKEDTAEQFAKFMEI